MKSLLVLAGEPNTGKSHTAGAILRFAYAASFRAFEQGLWPRVPSASFVRWPEVACEIRARNLTSIEDMHAADLLIMDDIGAEHDPWREVTSALCQVLSRREEKFTVITTNIAPEQWPEKFDVRIADRLLRNSEVVNLFGLPSYAMIQTN